MTNLGQGNTNPGNPNFPGASGYVSVQGNILTAVPMAHLADPTAARKLAVTLTGLYGKLVTVAPDLDYPNVQPSGPLQALALVLEGDAGWSINAQYLLMMVGTDAQGRPNGAWTFDPNGAPMWDFSLAPKQPAPPPVSGQAPGTPGAPPQLGGAAAPTANPTAQPILDALKILVDKTDAALNQLPKG